MRSSSARSWSAAPHRALIVAALLTGAACSSGAQGNAGQPCYPNATCNAGLTCEDGTCVAATATTTAGTGGTSGSTASASTTGSAGATTGTTTSTTSTVAAGSPPEILSFGASVTSITQGDSIMFSAIVTDPDGIDDLIGGDLRDESGNTYGVFATSAQEGAYEITLTWEELNHIAAINFSYGTVGTRTLSAHFFDQAGHIVDKAATITLTCNGLAACSGACVDPHSDVNNCGACGTTCAACSQGKCTWWSACLPHGTVTTCDAFCGAGACANVCPNDHGPGPAGVLAYDDSNCAVYVAGFTSSCSGNVYADKAVRCCCTR